MKRRTSAGAWRVTETVDSRWAGTVQIKWNAATGESFHSVGYGSSAATWLDALQHLAWTPIAPPSGGWKNGPVDSDRFDIRPHVVFGRDASYATQRAAVFLIDTYSGAVYVACLIQDGQANFFYHDEVRGATWRQIEEAKDLQNVPVSVIGRYEISAVNSTYPIPNIGRLGPYLTRLDTETGRVDVAIPTYLFPENEKADVVAFTWYPISERDSGLD